MLKWLALTAVLAGGFSYASDKTDWVKFGSEVVERVAQGGGWKSILPDLYELAGIEHAEKSRQVRQKSYTGRITRISDGDTVHVTDGNGKKHKIRMAHIDAPELNQAYGTRARDQLVAAADNAKVRVKVFELDRYGREVAQVFAGDTDLNLQQIREGAAWHYESYARKQQNKLAFAEYAAAQKQAKKNRKGLWRGNNPQAPWDWRKQQNARQNHSERTKWFGW
ncbi:thermonuclease family protein [Neisseria sp. CCUG12390]|uniref:thermonuclease family protein n=1 Tax=Neisseria sp. CCUG12390 TaxID=3392035 RepID=UPI003A103A93